MASFKGKIKYNINSVRKGITSGVNLDVFDRSVIDEGEYLTNGSSTASVNPLSQIANYKNGLVPALYANTSTQLAAVNYGDVYDATTASNGRNFYLTTLGRVFMENGGTITDIGAVFSTTTQNGGIWTHIDSTGVEKIYMAAENNGTGNWLIRTMNNDGTGLATTLTTAVTAANALHRGISGLLNRTYYTNGQYIGTYDPTTNTYAATKLNLGVGWYSNSIRNFGNYVAITGYKANSGCRLWLWDGASEFANFQYEINDAYATCYADAGKLYIFTYGRSGTAKLYLFQGADIGGKPLWQVTSSSTAVVPEQGSVTSYNDGVYWSTYTGQIYCYSDVMGVMGVHNPLLTVTNKIYTANHGVCKCLNSTSLTVAGGNNSSASSTTYIAKYDYNQTVTNSVDTYLGFPSVTVPHNSNLEYVKVLFNQFKNNTPNAEINVWSKDENDENNILIGTLNWSDVVANISPLAGTYNYTYHIFNDCQIPKLDILKLYIIFKGCVIREIEVGYSYDELSI